TPGHTPGHTSHVIASGSDKVFVQADVALLPALFVRNPGWHPTFDFAPDVAEQTRRKVYDMLAAEKMLLQGFHYPFPGVPYIERRGADHGDTPALWKPTICAPIRPPSSCPAGMGAADAPRGGHAAPARRGGDRMNLPRRQFLHLAAGAAALPAMSRISWA